MPALITAFPQDLDIVRLTATRLAKDGGEVRCYLQDDDHELRNIGCKIAVGSLEDEDTLASALTNVHTFIALAPDVLSFGEKDAPSLQRTLQAWAAAAKEANVPQNIVVVSGLTVPYDPVCSAMGDSPEIFEGVRPLCLIRCGLISRPERPLPRSGGHAEARVLPVGDLVDLIALIDDRESTDAQIQAGGRVSHLVLDPGVDERMQRYAEASLDLIDDDPTETLTEQGRSKPLDDSADRARRA